MEKRKYIVLLAAVLLVIGAPSLLFAGGGKPTAIKESFRVGEQDCQLNVAFDQLGDSILATSATTLNSEDDGFTCDLVCGEGGECQTFCYRSGGEGARLTAAAAPAGPSWCNNNSIVQIDNPTVVCEKKDCKPNKKGTYDCTTASFPALDPDYGKCERRDSVHRRTAERLGNNTQVCVTPRTGPRYCLGTP